MEELAGEFLIAAGAAGVVTVLFVWLTRGRSRAPVWAAVFVLMFTASLAGSFFIRPVGPLPTAYRWIQFAVIGLFAALVFTLFAPRRPPHGRQETLEKLEEMEAAKEWETITHASLWPLLVLVVLVLAVALLVRLFGGP